MNEIKQIASRSIILGIIGNVALAALKFVVGIFGNSFALIADAVESTTDIFSSILLLFGVRYSVKPADENHPYGHGRADALFSFIVVVFLVIAATSIINQAIVNLQSPQEVPQAYTLYVLAVVIAIKEALYRYTKRKGKAINSTALQAEAIHHRSDALTSLFAAVGITVALVGGAEYAMADEIAALIAAFFIFLNAYRIFRPALGEIMDEHTHQELEAEIRKISKEVEGVKDTEKCYIRKIGVYYIVDLHAIVDGNINVTEGHEISHNLKDSLMENLPNIGNVNIHIEPYRPSE